MNGRDEEHGGSSGIGPPSGMSMPRGEAATGTPERTSTGDPAAAPGRSRLWPPAEFPTGPLGGRWLFPPRQLAAHEQQLLKEELAHLARDGGTTVAVAAGAATGRSGSSSRSAALLR